MTRLGNWMALQRKQSAAVARYSISWFQDGITRKGVLRLATRIALWCLLTALLSVGMGIRNEVTQYASVSLRYEPDISGKTAYAARQYSIEHADENPFWPTFWREERVSLSVEYAKADVDGIFFSGNAMLVWPARYLAGAAPGVTDGAGVALSDSLAWTLFGSTDVVGMEVKLDEETRVIRGVFEGETALALLSTRDEDTAQSWSAAELSAGPADATRADAESYATASGLGKPDSILTSGAASFANAMSLLPLLLMAAYGLALCLAFLRRRPVAFRQGLFFLACLTLAFSLPTILETLPGWMIPTRWSDFAFWSELFSQAEDSLREFLSLTPRLRDVEMRLLLLKQAGIALASTCCALSACFLWHRDTSSGGGAIGLRKK